jgi:hypothetical protein
LGGFCAFFVRHSCLVPAKQRPCAKNPSASSPKIPKIHLVSAASKLRTGIHRAKLLDLRKNLLQIEKKCAALRPQSKNF